jgi:hypothetical protein
MFYASRDALKPELKERPIFCDGPTQGGSQGHLLGRSSSPEKPMTRPYDLSET